MKGRALLINSNLRWLFIIRMFCFRIGEFDGALQEYLV